MGKKANKLLRLFVCCCLILVLPVEAWGNEILPEKEKLPSPPNVVAKAAVLIDAKSGDVLYQKNMNEQLPPASTTKILTGIIAIEKGNLKDKVVASKLAANTEASAIYLLEGEQVSLEDLVWALLLNSANDAAVAIAEHLGGSVEGFAKIMNSSARAFGAKNSNFDNPNGLPDEKHRSTAYDLAMIAKHAMENPKFREIVGTKKHTITRQRPDGIRVLFNHNKLLSRYEGATGIKTGYTTKAQQCLVASAKRGDREFISVVLGSKGNDVWTDSTSLLDYGFKYFDSTVLAKTGEQIKPVAIKNGTAKLKPVISRGLAVAHLKGQEITSQREVKLQKNLRAPIEAGKVIGQVTFAVGDKQIGSVDVVAANSVAKVVPRAKFSFLRLVEILGAILVGLVGLRIWLVRRRRMFRRQRRRISYLR